MNELFEEKMKIVLNLIRTNNTSDEALKVTQAAYNLAQARNSFNLNHPTEDTETKPPKKQGTGTT